MIEQLKEMAPAWAKWIAIDETGVVWAYENEPSWSSRGGIWFDYYGGRMQHLGRVNEPGNGESLWAM